ncbi:unnamed protein product [Hyaloperonospora brassicae]|uniref:Uncharacterized protein n=1 Tax=Hyaloperonospora brassicae TaxID=162125 RepID=A0AAV0V106_HYABA|nr:unnamed protein product [Hyaloperonospora brassicae]
MDAVRSHHDDTLTMIERTLLSQPGGSRDRVELRVNQTVPGLAGQALRLDLQLYNHSKKTVAVVDLAVAFEEQAADDPTCSDFARVAVQKRTKYDCIKRHLEHQDNSLLSASSPAAAYGICTAANTKRGSKVKDTDLGFVTIKFKVLIAGQVKFEQGRMQGAVE